MREDLGKPSKDESGGRSYLATDAPVATCIGREWKGDSMLFGMGKVAKDCANAI